VHKDQRHDRDQDFLRAARSLGEQFVKKYCKGCSFHYGQSVRRVSMHVHADDEKRTEFKKLAFAWQKAPLEAKDGVPSANQVVAKIDLRFPSAKNWTAWWKKRAHLIIEADMGLAKPDEIMQTYPTTDNNLEAFHATFAHAVPRSDLPLFLGVSMAYHFTENCRSHAKMMAEGYRKANRKRGSQHNRRRLPKALQVDEWIERPPESGRALRPRKQPRL
jgi:ribosomal protein L44E